MSSLQRKSGTAERLDCGEVLSMELVVRAKGMNETAVRGGEVRCRSS